MLKFALAAGIVYEWVFGPSVLGLPSFATAALHTFCATLLAWMVLETGRVLLRAAMSLEDEVPGSDGGGSGAAGK